MTTCHHVPSDLVDWYAAHPRLVCARCWVERGRRDEAQRVQAAAVRPAKAAVEVGDAPRLFD